MLAQRETVLMLCELAAGTGNLCIAESVIVFARADALKQTGHFCESQQKHKYIAVFLQMQCSTVVHSL